MSLQFGLPVDSNPIVGIDLGTTHSLVAYVRDGEPEVLRTREGERLLPSIVSFAGDSPLIGYSAKRNKVRDASHTVYSVKRLLGRGFKDLEAASQSLPYKLVPGEGVARIQMGDRAYSAIEVSALILRELKLSAEAALGVPVTRAVVTVPAYFNDSQRQATRAAGRLAGLDVLRIINEPTAASLAYGLDRKKQGLIAVYDLGGGTFDVSILKLHDGIFEVLSTHGNTSLGGDDLDLAIAALVEAELASRFGVDVSSDIQLRALILEKAEALKIALSTQETAELEIELAKRLAEKMAEKLDGEKVYRRSFTREEFESLARPILEKTREPCIQALKDAGLGPEDLSDVVMVGGPTRLGIVQRVAEGIFGKKPNTSVHPDEVVAIGAAIQADILAGKNKEFLLLDVVPLSLGLETYGGLMSVLIPRNTRIPAVAREGFTTFVDNQTAVDIHVLQGEREKVEDNRSLARFKLRGIQPGPAGLPRIEVSFLIDADGILQVSARDLKNGNEQTIEVKPSFGLTDAEVEKMLLSSAENAEGDVSYRKLVDVRNEAEIVLRAIEKKLPEGRRLLPEPEVHQIESDVNGLRIALAGTDPVKIQAAASQVNKSTVNLANLLMTEAFQRASSKES